MRMSEYKTRLPDEEQVDLAVEVFRMLADATRVRLLLLMREGELSVRELTDGVAKPQALVSAILNAEHAGPDVPLHHQVDTRPPSTSKRRRGADIS